MAFSGILYALSPDHKRGLLASQDDAAVVEYVAQRLLEADQQDTDHAWELVHRCLTDGYCRTDNGTYPLNLAILGGLQLHDGEDYIVSYVSPAEVHELIEALDEIDEAEFGERFSEIDEDDCDEPLDDESRKEAWTGLCAVRDFYSRAAEHGHAAVFVVAQ
jgi:hypothetical protein